MRDRLADRQPAEQQHLEVRGVLGLGVGRTDRDRVTVAEHDELVRVDRSTLGAGVAAAARARRPSALNDGFHGTVELRARAQAHVRVGDRRVRRARDRTDPPRSPAISRTSAPPSLDDANVSSSPVIAW